MHTQKLVEAIERSAFCQPNATSGKIDRNRSPEKTITSNCFKE
jgi:hypothetical protein